MKINPNIRSVTAILLVIAMFNSCSTKKNTFVRRTYHNLTSRDNAYFNGNESYKTGVSEIEKAHVDDYTKVLPVYKLGTTENATAQGSYFDKAYVKASKVITNHSIFISKKEHVKWIPEAYMLIGKSYFYKKEYKLATETFNYIIKTYPEFPAKYNSMVWSAKTFNQQKKYENSQTMLDLFQDKMDKNLSVIPKQALKEFPLTYADYYIKQENYGAAIEYLLSGIDKNRKKAIRERLRFILAQIYQNEGKVDAASKLYDKVIKMNPPYVMGFNARINKAMCFDATTGNSKEIKKLLLKMAKEDKNKDFLDQIYYALAEICMKEKDTACAIDNYKLSAIKSVSNNNQKATSYLKLAKLYFSMPDYENAEAYYDSTMIVLPKDYPDYKKTATLTAVLRNLVKNLRVVQLQDSLQRLSKMSAKEKNEIVDGIITQVIKEEQKKQEEELLRQQSLNNSSSNANSTFGNANSSWYFYNPNTSNLGKTDFLKKWGNRKLEDLWRLSDKQSQDMFGSIDDFSDTTTADTSKTKTKVNLKDRNYYLKNIPVTAADIKKSNALIVVALYNLGVIYQNDLTDIPKAIDSYGKLVKRFPDDSLYSLKTYYQLYGIYSDLNDDGKMDYYKNVICTKSPESDYCNLIKDPNYKRVTKANKHVAANLYEETYDDFKTNQWDSVMAKTTKGIEKYGGDTILAPKYMYMKAVVYGKRKDSANFVKLLQTIIDKYPHSEVRPKAEDLLDFWTGRSKLVAASDSAANAYKEAYHFDDDAIYLYVMVVTLSKNLKIADVKNAISDFNTKNFSTDNLTVSNVFLDNTRQIVSISSFQNDEKAMSFYNLIKSDKDVFAKLKPSDYKDFVITVDNYPKMYKKKDIDGYYQFFSKNYLE